MSNDTSISTDTATSNAAAQSSSEYADIINHKYRGVRYHPKMSMSNRAAQFAPFAALNGHEEAIEETARIHTVNMD